MSYVTLPPLQRLLSKPMHFTYLGLLLIVTILHQTKSFYF